MKKLSDYRGEEAIDVLADIIGPIASILADAEIRELVEKKVAPIKYVKPALKNHKEEVLQILARIEGVPVEGYRDTLNVFSLPVMLLDLINDPQVKSLFTSQDRNSESSHSGPATVDTLVKEN